MSASSSLSVELWQTILRYSIGVYEFLDPDAFEGLIAQHLIFDKSDPRNDEALYWHAERERKSLQQVCQSWNTYLSEFAHRFVRLLDIVHGTIKPEVLTGTRRVSFGRYECTCDTCDETKRDSFEGRFCKLIDEAVELNMEIADLKEEGHQIEEFVKPRWRNFDKVKVFIAPSCNYCGSFAELVASLPELRHFLGKGYRGKQETRPEGLSSQHLVTLSFHDRIRGEYKDVKWDLPSLRHLRFKDDSNENMETFIPNALLPLLRALGTQLHTLYLYHQQTEEDMPKEIWELCPNMTSFRTGMQLVAPPFFHPIRTLRVARYEQLTEFKPLPEWPNLRKVILDRKWTSFLQENVSASMASRPELRVEDMKGLTVDEMPTS